MERGIWRDGDGDGGSNNGDGDATVSKFGRNDSLISLKAHNRRAHFLKASSIRKKFSICSKPQQQSSCEKSWNRSGKKAKVMIHDMTMMVKVWNGPTDNDENTNV